MRIVSFLPSGTEIVLALGAGSDIVGVSHENLGMAAVKDRPVVSHLIFDDQTLGAGEIDRLVTETYAAGKSIYRVDRELLQALRPELLITQELCEVCAVTPDDFQKAVGGLEPAPQILSLNAHTLAEAEAEIERTAQAIGRPEAAAPVLAAWRRKLEGVSQKLAAAGVRRARVACLEWPEPLYNAGHWVPEMVERAGGEDGLASAGEYSHRIAWAQLREYQPEVLVMMFCGLTMERARAEAERLRALPGFAALPAVRARRAWVVNGPEYFSQSGPRLAEGVEILAQIIHPQVFGAPHPEQAVRLR